MSVTRTCVMLTAFVMSACGSQTNSKLDGHYEDSDATTMNAFRGQQTVQPEYAPVRDVIVSSALLSDFGREDLVKGILDAGAKNVYVAVSRDSGESKQSSTFSRLQNMLGANFSRVQVLEQEDYGGVTVWARDWSPLGALTRSGKLRLLDLNYYPRRPADDATGRTFAGLTGIERVSVPVYNEGGNFMINGRGECLMTTRVTDANAEVYKDGDMVLDANAVKSYYGDFAGCKKLNILPRMPTEATGHIDMWGKFLSDDLVIVNEISAVTLEQSGGQNRALASSIQNFLNNRAADLQALGYSVKRIPMPLPRSGFYRSYTNSLLVNGVALVPQYESRGSPDQSMTASYEAAVRKIYEAAGYKIVFIPSDQLIATGGAVHCVTMQVPAAQ